MLETLKNAFKTKEIRVKIFLTLALLLVYRIGCYIPVPGLSADAIGNIFEETSFLSILTSMSGGSLQSATLFSLGILPFINAFIIMQLLTLVIPKLEKLSKEGDAGRRKITQITRYVALVLAAVQGIGIVVGWRSQGAIVNLFSFESSWDAPYLTMASVIIILMAGSTMVMWLGERITEYGVGNGISMILFAGIVSRGPSVVLTMWQYLVLGYQGLKAGSTGTGLRYMIGIPVLVVIFVIMVGFIVLMTKAERRIPIQYAKRVVGRKMYGGQSSYIPVNVNMSGVMPIIFASSLMAIPGTIAAFVEPKEGSFWAKFVQIFNYNSGFYAFLYFILIIAFAYFYVAIQYNPVEMANNLRKNNGAIPGIRPGKPTSDFIARIISKVTLIGAMFCAVVAILPIGIAALTGIQGVSLGGTTIIIIVGVALDTVKQLESEMMMRHYKGFLE